LKKHEAPTAFRLDGILPHFYRARSTMQSFYKSRRNVACCCLDGSQIYADSHQIADCYLLHISRIDLRYGDAGSATDERDSTFFTPLEEDEWHRSASGGVAITSREIVDARRHIAELDELANLLEEPTNVPSLGLCDGIFDLRVSSQHAWRDWAQSENERVLDRLRQCQLPVAGYIAASRATDAATALRLVLRERGADDTVQAALAHLSDVRLFDALLTAGQRSAIFVSHRLESSTRMASQSVSSRHQTCFFYLKIEDGDVARLEVPHWVATRPDWIEHVHALTWSQIEKGGGYPIALMEAHEHAVVRAEDRTFFYALLEERMIARGLAPRITSKLRSKVRPIS
jgi:hypothetical protein